MSMAMTSLETLRAYEQHADGYAANSPQTVQGDLKAWIDGLLAFTPADARIFEIGSGTGKDADYIEDLGYKVERSDAAESFIGMQALRGKDVRQFNVLTDSFDDDRYDLIYANAVLLHFTPTEVSRVFDTVRAGLNRTGRFAFTVKTGEGDELTTRKLGAQRYFHYWPKEAITQAVLEAGFIAPAVDTMSDYRGSRRDWVRVVAFRGADA